MIENKFNKDHQIVSDMKECFRAFNLPIHRFKPVKGSNIMFTSEIRYDHLFADVGVTYSKILEHVGIDISLHLEVPSDRMAELWLLLNLCNERMPVYRYAIYQSLNRVSLRASLFISEGCLPIGKFKWLLHDMIEHTSLSFPLIAEVVEGAKPEELYDRLTDAYRDVMKMEGAISTEEASKILNDMESIIADLKIPIKERDRLFNGFVFKYWDKQVLDFPFRLMMLLFGENRMVVMTFTPSFTVSDEKVPVITELIGRISSIGIKGHLFFDRKTRQVIFQDGILIDNGLLDKKEFKHAFLSLLKNGCFLFPIIKEQILSNQTPEALEAKLLENSKGYHRL